MTRVSRILLITFLGLAASIELGATGVPHLMAAQAAAGAGAGAGTGAGAGSGRSSGEAFWVASEGGGAYLGVDVDDVTKERMAALKLKEERGVEVNMVDRDAPAGKAGLKPHDVILQFNGAKVESVEQLRRLIHETPAGRTVALGISRDGKPMTLHATLAERNMNYNFNYNYSPKVKMPKVVIPKVEMPDMRDMPDAHEFQFIVAGSGRAGLLVENLTPQLGDFFGAKNGEGVLVRSVEKGSPAEAAGFKAGDIIIRVEQDKVADRSDWRSTLRSHRSGKVSVGIIRDKKEQTLSLDIPEVKERSSWRVEVPDMDELDNDLDDIKVEINQLGPAMERMKSQMECLKKELADKLQANLAQSRGQLRQAMEQTRRQLDTASRQAQSEATRAARQAQRDARQALEQQRQELKKVRETMRHRMEMD